jgi:hypothetical protein
LKEILLLFGVVSAGAAMMGGGALLPQAGYRRVRFVLQALALALVLAGFALMLLVAITADSPLGCGPLIGCNFEPC